MAEIRDDRLFTQSEGTHFGECPICCLPLPLDSNKWKIYSCCSKRICNGCGIANQLREAEQGLELKCPYCREPVPSTKEEVEKAAMERVKANDPVALCRMGINCYKEGDYDSAFEYFTKAAALGDMDAHFSLSIMYHKGEGVEEDSKKSVYHLEEAAIGGHPQARYNLALEEGLNYRSERAVKHWIIAAKLGHKKACEGVKVGFMDGYVSKDDFEAALRGHQAAVDATKSEQREAAEEFFKQLNQI
jgi:tetratricopeptide (TPR) repeat protein